MLARSDFDVGLCGNRVCLLKWMCFLLVFQQAILRARSYLSWWQSFRKFFNLGHVACVNFIRSHIANMKSLKDLRPVVLTKCHLSVSAIIHVFALPDRLNSPECVIFCPLFGWHVDCAEDCTMLLLTSLIPNVSGAHSDIKKKVSRRLHTHQHSAELCVE